jgi:hypothetical protein
MSLWKNRPRCSPSNFLPKLILTYVTFTMEKTKYVAQNFVILRTAISKNGISNQWPNMRKFNQILSPCKHARVCIGLTLMTVTYNCTGIDRKMAHWCRKSILYLQKMTMGRCYDHNSLQLSTFFGSQKPMLWCYAKYMYSLSKNRKFVRQFCRKYF